MLWLLVEIAIYIASTVLTMYLASKAKPLPASALGDFTAPTAEEGRVIPVVFGTTKLAGPNVVWYGDLRTTPLKSGGWMTFGFKSTYGYRYFLGMDLMLCHGPIDALETLGAVSAMAGKCVGDGYVKTCWGTPGPDPVSVVLIATDSMHFSVTTQRPQDALPVNQGTLTVGVFWGGYGGSMGILIVAGPTTPFAPGDQFSFTISTPSAIFANDKAVAYTTNGSGPGVDYLYLNSPKLFGGDKQGGGIAGPVSFYYGTANQPSNAYLLGKLPGANPVPSYAGYCHAVFEQVYIGTTNQINPFAFVVKRCPDPLAQGNGDLGGDANPAWIIWDIMTNVIYGLGIPSARFDSASFIAAAATLATEGLGLSLQIDNTGSADSFLSDVLRHISGVLYTDPASGLWTLKLVRADYDPTTIPALGDADLLAPPEFSRIGWDETLNEIKVKYCDRSLYFTPRVAQAQETANYAVRGQLASDSQDFFGLSNMNIAQVIAARELKAHSYPFGRVKLKTTRKAWNLRIGGVFAFSNSNLGFAAVPFRISSINYGELTKGDIELTAVEDEFGISYSDFYTPPASSGGWTNPAPTGPPPAPLAQLLMEAPYVLQATPQRFVLMMAARGDGLSTECDIQSSTSGPLALTNQGQDFTPYGKLRDPFPLKPEALGAVVIIAGVDLDTLAAAPLDFFSIAGEILSYASVTANIDGSYSLNGVARGLFDTLPEAHAAGTAVWFFGEGAALVQDAAYLADVTVTAKALPSNSFGETNPAQVPSVALTTVSRAQLPYPPGNVRANGVWYPDSTLGDALVTWADRHRVNQGQNIVTQDGASFPGGIEGNYHIVLSIGGSTVLDLPAQTGNAFTFTALQRVAVPAAGPVNFQITPTNGALVGPTRTLVFTMTGFGLAFGEFFGGSQT
jgi:hypothetical protein